MADSTRLSVTRPVSEPTSSSQHSSFTYPVDSDDELRRPGPIRCTSNGSRSPALSHEHSDDEDPYDPVGDSVISTRDNPTDTRRGTFRHISARGYSRIAELPQQSKSFLPGKVLNKFRSQPHSPSETGIESQRSTKVLGLWRWEFFNCVLAIGILGSMYTILRHYDGQRIPDWGTGINLSTLIALMATLLRMMLAFVVSEIIGQAKWNYFAGRGRPKETTPVRRLIETARFNDASQSLLGAVKLLPTTIRDPVTLTAVLVMIVSLGTGSIVQQAIQTQSCRFPMDSAHASIPISRYINSDIAWGNGVSKPGGSYNTNAAVTSALAPESEEMGSPISVGCSTGNCSFQNSIGGVYSTLGICSSCADTSLFVTSTVWTPTPECIQVDQHCEEFTANVTLPNGVSILDNITFPAIRYTKLLVSPGEGLDWAGDLASQDMKALSQWAVTNVTILSPKLLSINPVSQDFVAASCTLYPCLRSYTGEVKSGKLEEVLVGTVPAVPDVANMIGPDVTTDAFQEGLNEPVLKEDIYMDETTAFKAVQSPCLVNGTVWTKEENSSTLNLSRLVLVHADPDPRGAHRFTFEDIAAPAECIYSLGAVKELLFWMEGYSFNGSCTITIINTGDISAGFDRVVECDYQKFWLASFFDYNGTTAAGIIKRIEAFTDRLSNKMRMGFLNDPETVSGQVLQITVCSKVQYSWLAFPAALVAVMSGLLAWTMFQSSRRRGRVMVWKTSILPFLFYGEQFVVQNGEDVSADSTESSRRDEGAREPLLDLNQMEAEARQRRVRFDMFD